MAVSSRSQLVRLGVFSALGIGVFTLLVFMFKPMEQLIRGGFRVKIHLTYAGQIGSGTPVRYLGIAAGEVLSVRYAEPQRGGVLVTVLLREDAKVRNAPDAKPYVDTALMTGEAYIEFPQASPEAPLLKDGDEIEGVYRPTAPDLIARFGALTHDVDEAVVEMRHAVARIRDEVDSVADSFVKVAENAADLFEDRPIDDPKQAARPNISTVAKRLDAALRSINDLLGDETLRKQLKATIANLNTTSERLARAAAAAEDTIATLRTVADRGDTLAIKLDRTLDRQNANLDNVARSALETAEDLSAFLATGQRILTRIAEGEGSLGRLVSDRALYEQVIKTLQRIDEAAHGIDFLVTELREHPGDYVQFGKRATDEEERNKRKNKTPEPNP